jgi:Holliday junction resolvase-like predicted endonuclease
LKDGKPFKRALRLDIWSRTENWTKDLISEKERILNMVEVKSCWGGLYNATMAEEET